MKSGILITAMAGIMLFAAGCNSIPEQSLEFYEKQNSELAEIKNFATSGKIAIVEKNTRMSSFLNFSVNDDSYTLELTTLTGSTVFRLENTRGLAVITDSDGKQHTGAADNLIKRLTGISIPADRLPDIVRAIPGNLPFVRNENHTVREITHDEFTVTYDRYGTTGKYVLPEFITIKGQDLIIRIRINKWEI